MWYFPSEPGNGNVDALSGRTVTAVNASGTVAAVAPVVAVVEAEACSVDDDAVFGVGSAELEPGPPGEHAARASVAPRRNAVWSLRAARLGGVTGFTPRTIARTPPLRKPCRGHPIS
jgi:hypothetical protein